MAVFKYKFAGIPQWKPRGFTQDEIRDFGQSALGLMVSRIQHGINVHDMPAKPLALPFGRRGSVLRNSYPFQKQKKGLQPIRDWTYTGKTLAAMTILELKDGSVALGINWITNSEQFRIAIFNQAIEPMAGLSPNDKATLRQIIDAAYYRRAA